MKKMLLIINPTSGKMKVKGELLELLKIFSASEYAVSVYVTQGRLDASRYTVSYGGEFDLIAVCGGDGTFNEVMSGAMQIGFRGALGFLPCGTTNDFARTLNLPRKLEEAARLLVSTPARPMDFASFNETRYFSYIASFGAFTEVSYSTDQTLKNLLGHAAYVAEAAMTLGKLRSYRMQVDCDGSFYQEEYVFGAVLNTLSVGGVLKLKEKDVDVCDGFHEVLLVRKPKSNQDLANLSRVLLNSDFDNPSILLLKGKRIELRCDEAIPWCVDGEYAGTEESAVITNLHNCLQVVRP